MRIAINGFGRIGKNFLRVILDDVQASKKLNVAVINVGPSDLQAVAHAFKYDTIMGTYPLDVSFKDNKLRIVDINGYEHVIDVIAQRDPLLCNWGKYNIDWVVEASGKFTKRDDAQKHLDAGAKSVLITSPANGEDITIIPGINSDKYNQSYKIVSLGSCTTNALVPLLYVLEHTFKIERAAMTTIHSYTNTQPLLDVDATTKDLRRGRAAALNIVPTTTGAMEVIGRVMPEMAGKISGCSLRVPVPVVSLIDLTVILGKDVTIAAVNSAFINASKDELKGILAVSQEPLVSGDYAGNPYSVTVDALMTDAQKNMVKVFGWYDNEWGYSERLKDFLIMTEIRTW